MFMPKQICYFVMFSNLKLGKIRYLLLNINFAEFLSGGISSTRLSTCDFGTSTSGTSTSGTISTPSINLPTVNSK